MTSMDRAKRFIDLCFVVGTMPFWLCLIGAVALLCWLVWGRPILFQQQRVGYGGKCFEVLKFRSMTLERDSDGQLLSDERRLTRFGRVLRRTSLDELPQLINILRGEMSLVGPRPLLPEYLSRYDNTQRRRHEVRPGLTGWAQINGRNAVSWARKLEMDVWYVDNRSIRLDCLILLRTVGKVFAGSSVSAPGQATVEPFLGSDASAVDSE